MSRIEFQGLDVFAFADADTSEARAFTTYMGYWGAIARVIEMRYGSDFHASLLQEIRNRRPVRKLGAARYQGDQTELRQLLLGAWTQELGLYAVDDDDPRLMLQNLWNTVYAYYATSRAAAAFLLVRNDAPPPNHRKLLRSLAAIVKNSTLLPQPWSLSCTDAQAPSFGGFDVAPNEVSNLSSNADPFGLLAKALKTTRAKRVDQLAEIERTRTRRKRLANGERVRIDEQCDATTVFDFLWRTRTRSNYGDPSMFYVGTLDDARSRQYVRAVRLVTGATMLLFETLVATRAPNLVAEAGVHFISRDRTRLGDEVLGERLGALGVL